jgi:hypothetical protein
MEVQTRRLGDRAPRYPEKEALNFSHRLARIYTDSRVRSAKIRVHPWLKKRELKEGQIEAF